MSNFHVIVLVAYAATCQCGIIDEDILRQQKSERGASAETALNYGGWPEVDPEEPIEHRSVKQKRCPSTLPRLRGVHNFDGDEILGASAPMGLQRRDAQPNREKLCALCQAQPHCKVYKKCDSCKKWCNKKDRSSFEVDDSFLPREKGVPLESKNNLQMSIFNRFGDTSSENLEDARVSQSAYEGGKHVYTIANLSTGSMKEEICKLLGVSDVSDIDKLLVWVTTFSNTPPKFKKGYKKNVSPATEQLSESLNEELAKALNEKKIPGNNHLTDEEMETIAEEVLSSSSDGAAKEKSGEDLIGDTHHSSPSQGSQEALKTTTRFGSKENESSELSKEEDSSKVNEDDEAFSNKPGDGQLGENKLGMKTSRPSSVLGSAKPDDNEELQSMTDQKASRKPLTKARLEDLQNKLGQTIKDTKKYIDTQKNKRPDRIPELVQKRPNERLTSPKNSDHVTEISDDDNDKSNAKQTVDNKKETSQSVTNKPIMHFDPRVGTEKGAEDELLFAPKSELPRERQRPLPDEFDPVIGSRLSSDPDEMEEDEMERNIETNKRIRPMKNKLGQALKKIKPADTKVVNTEGEEVKHILGEPTPETPSEGNMLAENKADSFIGSQPDDSTKIGSTNRGTSRPITKEVLKQIQDKLEQRLKNLDKNIIKAKSPKLGMSKNFPNTNEIPQLEPLDTWTGLPHSSESDIKSKILPEPKAHKEILKMRPEADKIDPHMLGEPKPETPSEEKMPTENKADSFIGSQPDDSPKIGSRNRETSSPITNEVLQQIQDKLEQRLKNLDKNIIKAKRPKLGMSKNFPNKDEIPQLEPLDTWTGLPQSSKPDIKSKILPEPKADKEILKTRPAADKLDPLNDSVESENKFKADSTLKKAEPVTKNLLKQLKDKMDQRLKSALPRYQDIQTDDKDSPDEFKLSKKPQEKKLPSKQGTETESSEDPDSSMEPNHTPRKSSKAEETRKSIVGKPTHDFVEENLNQPQVDEIEEDEMGSQILSKSEVPRSRILSSNNRLEEIPSKVLEHIKKGSRLRPEVDNFKGAKEALQNVEDLVDEITKDTNIKLGKDPSVLEAANKEEGEPNQYPGDNKLLGLPHKGKFHKMFKKPYKSILFNKGILGRANELEDEKVGSQPVEEVSWDTNAPPKRLKDMNLRNSKTNPRLGLPVTDEINSLQESKEMGIPVVDIAKDAASTEDESPTLRSRAEFSEPDDEVKGSPWSKSLGNLLPLKADESANPKDMYFIGNGIKLPLQMIHKNDGAVHLSVDLDKLCSCKNVTCQGNHTAGTILRKNMPEKEDEMGDVDQEKHSQDGRRFGSLTRPYERKATNTWLGMKNKIASHLDPNEEYEQGENLNVFKRSAGKSFVNTIESESEPKSKFQSTKLNMNIRSSFVPHLNNKLLNTIRKNEKKERYTEPQSMQQIPNIISKTGFKHSRFLSSDSIKLNSKLNSISKEKDGDSKADKFKKKGILQNKVQEYVDGFSKGNGNRSKRKNSFIKEEVGIMNNVLTFLKTLSSDKRANSNKYII